MPKTQKKATVKKATHPFFQKHKHTVWLLPLLVLASFLYLFVQLYVHYSVK